MVYFTGRVLISDLIQTMYDNINSTGLWQMTKIPKGLTYKNGGNGVEVIDNIKTQVISQSNGNGSYYAYLAFAKDYSTGFMVYASYPPGHLYSYIIYDFGITNDASAIPQQKVVDMYSIRTWWDDENRINTYTGTPTGWTLYGSNDNSTFTQLHKVAGQTGWTYGERRFFRFINTTAYRYYKLTIDTTSDGTFGRLSQIEFYNSSDTTTGGFFLKSSGSSNTDDINLYINSLNTHCTTGNMLEIGTMTSFNPSTLVSTDFMGNLHSLTATMSALNYTKNVYVTYHIDVTKDRIFFNTSLDQNANSATSSCCYLGLMKRHSLETDSTAVTTLAGVLGTNVTNPIYVLRDKARTPYKKYTQKTITPTYSPSIWGNQVFVSPIFLEGDYEGIRGELDGVYTSLGTNLVDQDEIIIGNVRYKVFVMGAQTYTSFPNKVAIIKLP